MTFGGVSDPELQFVYGTCDVTADGCFSAKGVLNSLLFLLAIFKFALHIKHYRIGENQRV